MVMNRLLKISCLSLVVLILLFLALIIFLELGSQWYIRTGPSTPAPAILVCHLDYYPVQEQKVSFLEDLVQKHIRGERIQPGELEAAAVLAAPEDMPGLNGILCNGMIIISSQVPDPALSYVIRHELEHVFQMEGLRPDCQDWELCATWAAALEYPQGFLTTVIYSLGESYRISPSFWDFLFGSWYIFKVYLLP